MRRLTIVLLPARVLLVVLLLLAGTGPLHAQDAFKDPPPSARGNAAPAPVRQTLPSPAAAPTTSAGQPGEAQDFGVQAATQLRPTDQLHGPTPTSIPGGRVVSTRQLAQWLQQESAGKPGRLMLLHAIGSPVHLPQAIPAAPASQGGSFDDQVQREFGDYLNKATGGDRSRLIVTYCQSVQCWGSYNAALRAIRLGYSNVHWFRGGMEAWRQAGLPLIDASQRAQADPARDRNDTPR